ncbi:hypothetical protein D3C71_22270 [compost metagenome]
MSAIPNRAAPELNESDRKRLEAFAPLFDVVVDAMPEQDNIKLRVLDRGGWRESQVRRERLHTRLLAELCSKTVRWVYFPLGEPCHKALLGLADSRIERIAQLYNQQRKTLLQLDDQTLQAA